MKPTTLSKKQMPREKILTNGADHVSLQELCAVIIGSGTQKESAFQMGARLAKYLEKNPHFNKGLNLINVPKTVEAKILAAYELGRRLHQRIMEPILSPLLAVQHVPELQTTKKEMIVGIYIDSRSRIIHKEVLAIGGLNQASLHPRDLFLPLREHPATNGFILLHNHPSGNPEPSSEDIVFTKRVQEACQLLGLRLEDHIVVTSEAWVSFREKGLLR